MPNMDKLELLANKLSHFSAKGAAKVLLDLKARLEAEAAARPRIVKTLDAK